MENSGYNLAGFDQFKGEKFARLEKVNYKDLEDMVYRMELNYDEILDILNVTFSTGSPDCYTITLGI